MPVCDAPSLELENGKVNCLRGYEMGSKCRYSCDRGRTLVGGETKNECVCSNPWRTESLKNDISRLAFLYHFCIIFFSFLYQFCIIFETFL